jgi:MATE family multidrug resistance protein
MTEAPTQARAATTGRSDPRRRDMLGRHVLELLRLAVPVIGARAGQMIMVAVDTLVVGHYGIDDLAYLGLAGAPQAVIITALAGLLLGTIVLTAQVSGAGRPAEAGAVWRRSLPYALLLGVLGGLLCLAAEPFFLLTGQAPDIAGGAARVLWVIALGLPGAALFFATSLYLEGLKRPVPGMIAMLLANGLNAALNWVLVFGHLGLPALGAVGSAWSTTMVRWAIAVGLIVYVLRLPGREALGIDVRPADGWLADWRAGTLQRRIGYAAGMSNGIEAAAFSGLSLIAGLLGPLALGGYTVALNLLALPFMAALGIAQATAVRVGTAHGARDRRESVAAGWTGLVVMAVLLLPAVAAFALVPETIAAGFASDPRLIASIAPVVAFTAWILVADGGQVVMAQALRGRGDSWVPTLMHFFSYLVLMVPACWTLAIPLQRGLHGLFEGILGASLVSVSILAARFAWLSRR